MDAGYSMWRMTRAEWVRMCAENEWVEKTWNHKLVTWIHGLDARGYRNRWVANKWLPTFRVYICMCTNKARGTKEHVMNVCR